jgi:hypothetical protein
MLRLQIIMDLTADLAEVAETHIVGTFWAQPTGLLPLAPQLLPHMDSAKAVGRWSLPLALLEVSGRTGPTCGRKVPPTGCGFYPPCAIPAAAACRGWGSKWADGKGLVAECVSPVEYANWIEPGFQIDTVVMRCLPSEHRHFQNFGVPPMSR